ncbi:MAG: LUD domain-containing protein [Rubricoccaceae bacterium]
MSARESILNAARRNAPSEHPLPESPVFPQPTALAESFITMSESIGARVVEVAASDVELAIREAYPDAERIASAAPARFASSIPLDGDPHELATLELFVCEGILGVAENGAVWLPESRLPSRAAPFLASHVALVLDRSTIVATMHDAYRQLGAPDGFGVFVAGPSKTADIEQSLVIGAHGPVSLTLVLVA